MNADQTRSSAQALAEGRKALLQAGDLHGQALRDALADRVEAWLAARAAELGVGDGSGFALVAVGSLGRREMVGYSDLDLVLVHDDRNRDRLSDVADGFWYPIWDAGIGLDHSVRSIPEAMKVAREDVTAALGLLDARFVAGDEDLAALMISSVRGLWRAEARMRLPEVIDSARARWDRTGEIAHRAEPDLKNGRGGLRDIQLLDALAFAQLTDGLGRLDPGRAESPLRTAYRDLLAVRTELHLVAGRARDQVRAQDADEIAAALDVGDRFDLARVISRAARTTSYAVDAGFRTAQNAVGKRGLSKLRRMPMRRPLDEGVVEHSGEVVLAKNATPSSDPGLVLRVASASARNSLPINGQALARLANYAPPIPEPWSAEDLSDLLVLLASGDELVGAVEALDAMGLWETIVPEWPVVRDLPPRDAVHSWTVDRHLLETVAHAGSLTTSVARPDLLLLGALLHDIGKGRGGDHSVVGAELVGPIADRFGLWPDDRRILVELVRHHLLFPAVVTRRDVSDPETIAWVAEKVGGDRVLVELLGALSEADSRATGPGVWNDWKATLVGGLVERVIDHLGGREIPQPEPLGPEVLALAEAGGFQVHTERGDGPNMTKVTMIAPDRSGVLSKMSAVLALADLQAHAATVRTHAGSAVDTFVVMPTFGSPSDPVLLRQRLAAAVDGGFDVHGVLAKRTAERGSTGRVGRAAVPGSRIAAAPRVRWLAADQPGLELLELRARDDAGLLARVTVELEKSGVDIAWATVATMGATAVDTFCLALPDTSDAARESVAAAVLSVC
ncbi:[protein-PII] uridylyltransferase [Gordonia sp. HY285]|uniref:[protein-PII] uridylyltransferase n=1 Tax=Gordonia liuliyuniae TaxID=2911517 RepID=UPI001EFF709D|nr:[protein-PII] uridylyltransferase [Gordonia liuliyuniae]MCF8610936.1 [protein-PII] uridylyltransferase [Gordonia liuliyuniae]